MNHGGMSLSGVRVRGVCCITIEQAEPLRDGQGDRKGGKEADGYAMMPTEKEERHR